MRPQATFKQISRSLMDSWISSPDGLAAPEDIYGHVCQLIRPNMVLVVVDVRPTDPLDFGIDVVQGYRLPTGLADIGTLRRSRSFADVPDTKYLHETVIPVYVGAVQRRRPTMGRVATRVLDTVIAYDQIILPQKNSSERSEWCIGLLDIHFLLPAGTKDGSLDDVDLTILQLLAEGSSTKEIASASNLSYRTIEHRIDNLKSRFGAKNIAHLAVLSIAAGLGGMASKDP
ncbi:hypothetical protein B5K08_17470 [Rhizobium leguminosarum bv. trifolii]|uniref:HTH luxR-type domain-containing protein n=1 Tax=Rhizobium leguminosarum bv. trifolii TaxID=386 RepID=A0A3E1BFJ9_RHILT|nr:LuxR C-terminal-related transcriptional regulator [Rhizobium leguminosarum]RFB90731.1 hypothetical protein B5K08_17470 [Rhizobium leguminosarum bv. trifolii]RFB91104.1 hypothetical protein B5K10_17465 [Rhizobium leguminosarum bv. trifolii]